MKKFILFRYKSILCNLAWILFILALIPSSNYHVFNGFPFSSLAEYALLLTLLPFLFLRKFSRLHRVLLGRVSRKLPLVFISLAVLAAGMKVALFRFGTYAGFAGCYTSPAAAPAAGSCERSYENPFFRFGATRIDRFLRFDQSNWDLGFVNSNRFNFYAWVSGSIDRKRLPLSVKWTGTVEIAKNEQVGVTYVGEGQIKIGAAKTNLPAAYQEDGQVMLTAPPGVYPIEISYTFNDGYRVGDPTPGEYATFNLWKAGNGSQERLPLTPVPPTVFWRLLGSLVDLIVVILWISILYTYVVILRRKLFVLLILFLAGWGTLLAPEMPGLTHPRILLVLVGALFAFLFFQPRTRHNLLLAYLCFACLGLFRILMDSHGLGNVIVQFGGTDQLTYESFAREILETGSLRGGEAIFYYQPAYRYLAFLLHILLGEGSVFFSALAVTALNWGILFLSNRLIRHTVSLWQRLLMLGTVFVVLLLVNSSQVTFDLIQYGASEYPTWIILSLALGFILSPKPLQFWPIITLTIGLGMITRTEQIPALALIYAIFLIRVYKAGIKKVLPSLVLLLVVFLLPAIHNLYYGGTFEILPTSKGVNENIAITPIQALTTINNSDTWNVLIQQIKDVAGFGSRYTASVGLALPLYALQVLWLLAWLFALIRWRSIGWIPKSILLLPLAYLGIYLFYYSHFDYPRHVLAGLLAMGYGILTLASGFVGTERVK